MAFNALRRAIENYLNTDLPIVEMPDALLRRALAALGGPVVVNNPTAPASIPDATGDSTSGDTTPSVVDIDPVLLGNDASSQLLREQFHRDVDPGDC